MVAAIPGCGIHAAEAETLLEQTDPYRVLRPRPAELQKAQTGAHLIRRERAAILHPVEVRVVRCAPGQEHHAGQRLQPDRVYASFSHFGIVHLLGFARDDQVCDAVTGHIKAPSQPACRQAGGTPAGARCPRAVIDSNRQRRRERRCTMRSSFSCSWSYLPNAPSNVPSTSWMYSLKRIGTTSSMGMYGSFTPGSRCTNCVLMEITQPEFFNEKLRPSLAL